MLFSGQCNTTTYSHNGAYVLLRSVTLAQNIVKDINYSYRRLLLQLSFSKFLFVYELWRGRGIKYNVQGNTLNMFKVIIFYYIILDCSNLKHFINIGSKFAN